MKISALIIFTFLLPLSAFSQDGYQQDLKQIASITFPEKPKSAEKNSKTIYVVNRNGAIYVATASPVYKDYYGLEKKISPDSLFNKFITASLYYSACHLLYKKAVEMNGLKGMEFGYQTVADPDLSDQNNKVLYFDDSQKSYRYYQVFYVDNTVITFGYWTRTPLRADDKGLRAFFNGFKLNRKPNPNASNLAYKIGKGIGYALIAGMIVLLGLGTLYLMRKLS
ncbi:MAG TPA: hypothetical protein VFE53_22370 [Mucilaginibacter sp.]|jgi:hypothetical protein|nr:hypothetical protein [Mucilaginibacter sp.]